MATVAASSMAIDTHIVGCPDRSHFYTEVIFDYSFVEYRVFQPVAVGENTFSGRTLSRLSRLSRPKQSSHGLEKLFI